MPSIVKRLSGAQLRTDSADFEIEILRRPFKTNLVFFVPLFTEKRVTKKKPEQMKEKANKPQNTREGGVFFMIYVLVILY
jgi:hypothetical protein